MPVAEAVDAAGMPTALGPVDYLVVEFPAEKANFSGEIAAEHCNPASDQRGPADYKRHLVRELTARMLRVAVRRARGLDHETPAS